MWENSPPDTFSVIVRCAGPLELGRMMKSPTSFSARACHKPRTRISNTTIRNIRIRQDKLPLCDLLEAYQNLILLRETMAELLLQLYAHLYLNCIFSRQILKFRMVNWPWFESLLVVLFFLFASFFLFIKYEGGVWLKMLVTIVHITRKISAEITFPAY